MVMTMDTKLYKINVKEETIEAEEVQSSVLQKLVEMGCETGCTSSRIDRYEKSVDDEESGLLALIENLQRRDLDFIEEAAGIARLMQEYHLSQEQAARRLGKSQSAVANKLRLLRLPPSVLDRLRQAGLSERHARALLRLPDEEAQLRVLERIIAGGWTVARTEQYIDALAVAPAKEKRELGAFRLRDARVFLNSVRHQLDLARSAGIHAGSEQTENDREIVLTIRIPKPDASRR